MSAGFIDISTQMFFDREKVLDKLDKVERAKLSRGGAFVRRNARGRIRPAGKKGRVSSPGESPRTPTKVLKSTIFFGYDAKRHSVAIGPSARFGRRDNEIPSMLEVGGTVSVRNQLIKVTGPSGKRGAGGRFLAAESKLIPFTGTIRIEPRPYMLPALEAEAPKFPDLFKDAVR